MKRAKQAWCPGIAVLGLLPIFVGGAVGEPQGMRFSPGAKGTSGYRFQQGSRVGGFWGGKSGRPFFFGARQRAFSRFGSPRRDLAQPDGYPPTLRSRGFAPYGGWLGGGWLAPPTQLSSRSDRFVSEWIAKEPVSAEPESAFSDLSQSLLLKQGMNENEVVLSVGSPITRTASRSHEIWTFSSFDLLFAEGRLQGIR